MSSAGATNYLTSEPPQRCGHEGFWTRWHRRSQVLGAVPTTVQPPVCGEELPHRSHLPVPHLFPNWEPTEPPGTLGLFQAHALLGRMPSKQFNWYPHLVPKGRARDVLHQKPTGRRHFNVNSSTNFDPPSVTARLLTPSPSSTDLFPRGRGST